MRRTEPGTPGTYGKPFPEWPWLAELARKEAEKLIPLTPETADAFDCPLCGEPQMWRKGTVDFEHLPPCAYCGERKFRAEEAMRADARRGERLAAAGVPPLYRSGFIPPATWPALPGGTPLHSWRGENPWCVVVYGRSGAGKSFLASAIFGALVTGSRQFATVAEDDDRPIRGTWIATALAAEQLFGPKSSERFERLATSEILMLDDLGWETSAPAREKISTILKVRYSYKLPTLVTTNLDPIGTAERPGIARLDPALGRRLDSGAWIEMREKWSLK